jgi:hypothetical protein
MPNYCSNTFTCTSGKNIGAVLAPYISYVDEDGGETEPFLDFQKIHPMPDEPIVEDKDYKSVPDWYNWRVKNWGTKWNSTCNTTLEDLEYNKDLKLEDLEYYHFQTAWSPAIGVIQKLAEITGESFILYYEEEGIGFFGKTTITPTSTEDQEFSYEEDAEKIDPNSDIYKYCCLEGYFESKAEWEEEEGEE